ncbi:Protein of unknown function DUF2985 [Penicillium brevicompactum]|uniref:Integral membrane protein n=1 Tax=Penicillium brevicompactum TaxID=5074 RepID=A0A9W9URQ5_PENBR|nr:Protein of unknown function DUF2985 [Penicillium brevicompactum]KAJ5318972.1 Protein of unknown function DUF2985 [Penicillium brevicompactum]KAJ5322557.1 Protein of unknown function DUF2985 [Penicillium brevicompactum]KAJ5354099.1 Protein of unknown function DUF2985 [Penicillium brevicompactum]
MDPIEPAGDPERSQGQPTEPTESPPTRPGPSTLRTRSSSRTRRPSIRLSRFPSIPQINTENLPADQTPAIERQAIQSPPPREEDEVSPHGRRRSSSEPRPGRWSSPPPDVLSRVATPGRMMPVTEESSRPSLSVTSPPPVHLAQEDGGDYFQSTETEQPEAPAAVARPPGRLRRASQSAMNRFSRNRASTVTGVPPTLSQQNEEPTNEYGSHVVDVLDVIDPEVSALSTLTNVQNSLFIPNLGGFINRMPTYTITRPQYSSDEEQGTTTDEGDLSEEAKLKQRPTLEQLRPLTSMSSVHRGPRYAILPEGHGLEGWTREDFAELNDHVRHMLHSRRSKFKRSMKGFGQYVRKPLGFLVTLYATLITLFGLAWVLFLIGWINVGGKQLYVINVIDNVLVALFAIMGDGLAPFRAVDTYHMSFIAHYTLLTWKLRRKRALPSLKDKNDLPSKPEKDVDVEFGDTPKEDEHEFSVLDARQQLRLMHHQKKFAKSHTFYKPHETYTHHAFPLRFLIAIVVILDMHSLLQMALGACTWSMEKPGERSQTLTTVILCCSITCNITGGILIMIGDRRTRKKDVVERLFRQELTQEAMKKMEKKKVKEERRSMQAERSSMQVDRPSTQIERKSAQIDRKSAQIERPQPYNGT